MVYQESLRHKQEEDLDDALLSDDSDSDAFKVKDEEKSISIDFEADAKWPKR